MERGRAEEDSSRLPRRARRSTGAGHDERWRQAQERMREKRGASSGRSAARSTGTGRDTSAGQNSTTSEKLDSIFKGLLS